MFYWLQKNLPKIVIAPSFAVILWFVYGFVLWTFYISFTKSKMLPRYELWGINQHIRLWSNPRWFNAVENLIIFTVLFTTGIIAFLPISFIYLSSFGLTAIALSPIIVSGLVVAIVIFSSEFSI